MNNPKNRTDEPRRLTKRVVDATKPREADYVIWDIDIRGFGLRVLPSGRKVFILKYRTRDGRRQARKLAIGRYGDLTPDQARQIASAWRADIAKGKDPKGERDRRRGEVSFLKLGRAFVEQHSKKHKRSWKDDERVVERMCGRWHSKPAADITPEDVADLLAAVEASSGGIMANRVLASIRKLFAWAVEDPRQKIATNPAANTRKPVPEISRDRVYSEEEIKALWNSFGDRGTIGLAFKVAVATGQRRGEVAGMSWAELDGNLWTIPGARTKNGRVHVVPLGDLALDLIEGQRSVHKTWVFPSERRDGPVSSFRHAVQEIRKASKVRDFRVHDLRRTMSTNATRLGFSRFHVDCLLNHTQPGVGGVYDRHDYLNEKTKIAEAWNRRLRMVFEGGKVVQLTRERQDWS